MTTENQKNAPGHSEQAKAQDNTPDVPADSELFAGEVYEQLSVKDVFTGDEDFYKDLTDTTRPATDLKHAIINPVRMIPRFSTSQKVLAVSIAVITVILTYAMFISPSAPVPADQQIFQPAAESVDTTPQHFQKPPSAPAPAQPSSLNIARTLYLNGDYSKALLAYENLLQNLPEGHQEDLMRDFLQLRMALCMKKKPDYEQAVRLLRAVSHSRSPIVRVVANYRLSLLGMQKKQYLHARVKAYQAIALIDAVNFNEDWVSSMKQDCYFLAAEAITRKVLYLCDADKDLPEDLWSNPDTENDPFIKLDKSQLQTLLNSGSEQLSKALLVPQIQRFDHSGGQPKYTVTCHSAPAEELLTRFAANAGVDIHWALEPNEIGIRKRAVSLYLLQATAQQFITVASGYAGMLARMNEQGAVDIFDPDEYSYISKQISLLTAEAVSLWQKFLLRFHRDRRIANAHFALGLLQTQQGWFAEPITEYKLIANRFPDSPLAPFALLNLSKLKICLRNYPGACRDLRYLVEQYPDAEIVRKAYLYLAKTTARSGLKSEAARLYRKVYNLGFSLESQSIAAIGAGKCLYQIKDYESAAEWLAKYITLAKDSKSKDLYSAYFTLGKTYLALENPEAACEALQYALENIPSHLTGEEYTETVSALVEGYMQQGYFVRALDALAKDSRPVVLSQQESIAILLLKSRLLKAIGLVDKAIAILGDRVEYVTDPRLKVEISLGLADCYIHKGDFEPARKKLAEILVVIEPGDMAHEVALKLAGVCLKLDQDHQAVSVCLQILNSAPPEQIKQQTLDLLATVYDRQKDYDKAALALLGRWE